MEKISRDLLQFVSNFKTHCERSITLSKRTKYCRNMHVPNVNSFHVYFSFSSRCLQHLHSATRFKTPSISPCCVWGSAGCLSLLHFCCCCMWTTATNVVLNCFGFFLFFILPPFLFFFFAHALWHLVCTSPLPSATHYSCGGELYFCNLGSHVLVVLSFSFFLLVWSVDVSPHASHEKLLEVHTRKTFILASRKERTLG